MRSLVAFWSALAANLGARRESPAAAAKSAWTAFEYRVAIPAASRRSWLSVWLRSKSPISCTAIRVVTIPAITRPARKRSGRRKRSDENTVAPILNGPCVPLGLAGRRDLVADAPHRHDRGGLAELAPQLADV